MGSLYIYRIRRKFRILDRQRILNTLQAKLQEQLSLADAEVILGRLPERIQMAPIARATEIE